MTESRDTSVYAITCRTACEKVPAALRRRRGARRLTFGGSLAADLRPGLAKIPLLRKAQPDGDPEKRYRTARELSGGNGCSLFTEAVEVPAKKKIFRNTRRCTIEARALTTNR